MPSFDASFDYDKIKKRVESTKSYGEAKDQYNKVTDKVGESMEKAKDKVAQSLSGFAEKAKRYQKQLKNQLEQLLDIVNVSGGKGSGSPKYIKRLLLRTIRNVEPRIRNIVFDCLHQINCDETKTYSSTGPLYIKVQSVDLFGRLKLNPNELPGKLLFEKDPINPGTFPLSTNKILKELTDNENSPYSALLGGGVLYTGKSGQPLFNIEYVEVDQFNQTGPWFKVDLEPRASGINNVAEFISDYYSSIKMTEKVDIITAIMESLTGAVSMKVSAGVGEVTQQTQADRIILRILGLCFDGRTEIDVSGISKIAPLDGVDDSFFEFTEVDLREIDQRVTNIKNGVIEFEECGNVKVPVDFDQIIDNLDQLFFVEGSDFDNLADQLTNTLANNPLWGINVDVQPVIDTNFIKLITNGIVGAVMSPKVMLPIMIMLKAQGNDISDKIASFNDFVKNFKQFAICCISKIGAIFVEELFKLIKADILQLVQQVIADIVKEKKNKKLIMILKLIALLLIIAQIISDYRKCKSLIDEIFAILNLITTGVGFPGGGIPLPLLFGSQMLDGYSESRAFLGTIEEMQGMGVPTGALPDGSPNLDLLSKFSQMRAMANEEAENGKVEIALGVLSVTPGGTIPNKAYGKKI
jgi:predicted transcriptional regulator